MAGSLTDIFAAMQNGMIALGNLKKQMLVLISRVATLEAVPYRIFGFTRVLSVGTGNVSYTGIGFRPRLIQVQTGIIGGSGWSSFGQADAFGSNVCVEVAGNAGSTTGSFYQPGTLGIQRDDAVGANYNFCVLVSFDVDGFTLLWAKIGTPTATANITAICFR